MIAAGIILLACVGAYFIIQNMNKATNSSGPTSIIVNDVAYYNSGHTVEKLTAGFEYGGIVSLVKGGGANVVLNCNYYTNTEIPEWIYVYSGIISGYDKYKTYVLFATPEVLYKEYIMFNGQLYQGMWGYMAAEDYSDSLWSTNNDLVSRYGIRIEAIPEDCILVGNAHVEELNRIPQTALGVNSSDYDNSFVYADPDDSQVLYVSTSWHTATDEEKVDTLHNGYDVFVQYNPDAAE